MNNTAPIRRRLVEGARVLATKREIGMEDVSGLTQPLAELITAETGISVDIVVRLKKP